jgi:LemA protein
MAFPLVLILSLLLLLIIVFILIYNGLVKARNLVRTAFADIDVHLTKRFALVPNLIAVTKSYAHYESNLLQEIVETRGGKTNSGTEVMAEADAQLTRSLNKLMITVENYPDLKANDQFLELMAELSRIEDHLVFARRFYNGAVRVYNNKVQSFPSSMVAGMFGFTPEPFYEVGDTAERAIPVY